jgi:hypothetical protein
MTGAVIATAGAGFATVERIHTSGTSQTETVPTGASLVRIRVRGGGGPGGDGESGGGGGGGGFCERTLACAGRRALAQRRVVLGARRLHEAKASLRRARERRAIRQSEFEAFAKNRSRRTPP